MIASKGHIASMIGSLLPFDGLKRMDGVIKDDAIKGGLGIVISNFLSTYQLPLLILSIISS